MRALWRKSLADVTRRKGRTLLLVLGILIGVLGITAVNEAADLIGSVFFYSADASAVPNILFTVNTLPASVASTIQHLPNVAAVQQRTTYDNAPWILAGGAGTASIQINAYPVLQQQQLDAFQLTSGRLPGRGEIVMDVSDQAIQPIALGDTVTIATLTGQQVALRVVGLARTKGLAVWHPAAQAIAYMSSVGMEQLAPRTPARQAMPGVKGPPTVYGTQLLVKTQNVSTVRQTYNAIAAVLKSSQITTLDSQWIYADGFADTRLAVTGLLSVIELLAGLSLVLVGILIFNTVTTMLTEQTAIIGTMKAIGGTRWRIIRSYLVSLSLSSLVGTVLGVDLGLMVGYQLAASLTETVQQPVGRFQAALWVLLSGIAVGLLIPPLAALLPLWTGTRISVRDALAAYGVRASLRTPSHAWGRRIEWVPQTIWLGLRSLFRRPGRAAMTLLALTLAGALFMAVQVTNVSLAAERYYIHADMRIDLAQGRDDTASSAAAISALQHLPNVARVEPIDPAIVTIAGGELKLLGLPADTQLYQPQIVAGRWLHAHELGALVINNYAAARLHLSVGDIVPVQWAAQQAEQAEFRLVGIVHEGGEVDGSANPQGRQGLAFTTLENLNALRHLPADAAERLWLRARDPSPQALEALRGQIPQALAAAGLANTYAETLQQFLQGPNPLPIVSTLFDAMVILVALVGLLGLAHTLTASVLERRLEIGMVRSLGATAWRVGMIFVIEGVALALFAWGLGILLGLPAGAGLLQLLGTFLGPVDLTFQPLFFMTTLGLVLAVVCLASVGPALGASRVRIREALRYE